MNRAIISFLDKLSKYAGRKLYYPDEIGMLLQCALERKRQEELEQLAFQAKFLVKTQAVMQRIGYEAEGFDKLSCEFQSGIASVKSLFSSLIQMEEVHTIEEFEEKFLSMKSESFDNLLKLLSDLAWVKNWLIDGKPLPDINNKDGEENSKNDSEEIKSGEMREPLSNIRSIAWLALVLLILFIVVDPPVLTVGWILVLIVIIILTFIAIQSSILIKRNKSSRLI